MNIRISTGATVHSTSIGVLWLQRAGTGFERLLNRTMQISSRTITNSTMAVMIGSRIMLWKKIA